MFQDVTSLANQLSTARASVKPETRLGFKVMQTVEFLSCLSCITTNSPF